jgi:formate dehydrogenase iron-sulfur subunit
MKIYLPLDSAAVALGADEIAEAIHKHAQAKGVTVALVRNGGRGMVWLEPMKRTLSVGAGAGMRLRRWRRRMASRV